MNEPITCEIIASKQSLTTQLAKVARTCSSEAGTPMVVRTRVVRRKKVEPTLTLHLSAELASQQHPVWCLACRIACYADEARVSVMIQGGDSFSAPSSRTDAAPRSPCRSLTQAFGA